MPLSTMTFNELSQEFINYLINKTSLFMFSGTGLIPYFYLNKQKKLGQIDKALFANVRYW